MEWDKILSLALSMLVPGLGTIFTFVIRLDRKKIARLIEEVKDNRRHIAELEREVMEVTQSREDNRRQFEQLNRFFDDKLVRLERERDEAIRENQHQKQRIIELMERLEMRRR